ncbi:hypothetical protein GLYMA_17G182800v4 [Glycine max]|uniref:Uncharacterized protein n=1 Tax=Glycine max TaxID=3847 RepID=A0A0R0FQ65_SOYBN|nr:hypothetical protein GYH30_047707 [Glycine max]KRH04735.1 hypothetical protein GLYMA_17G182800v4 [Glycine max]
MPKTGHTLKFHSHQSDDMPAHMANASRVFLSPCRSSAMSPFPVSSHCHHHSTHPIMSCLICAQLALSVWSFGIHFLAFLAQFTLHNIFSLCFTDP